MFSGLCSRSDTQRYGKQQGDTDKHVKLTKLSGLFAYETVITVVTALWLSCGHELLAPPTASRALLPLERETRQPMSVQRNIETRSRNHWCSGKAISFAYSECLFEALGI